MIRTSIALGLTTFVGLASAPVLSAQDVRIETEVRESGSDQIISENLTVFHDGLVIDFMLKPDKTRFPQEVVAYVVREKRFVLMDTERKVRTEVKEADLLKILSALRSSSFVDDQNRFLFEPEFAESWDVTSGWLELRSPRLTYRARGKRPETDTILHNYFDFIDQFARLNATDPRRMPPFARLELNRAIKKYGFIPEVVEMRLAPDPNGNQPEIAMEARHVVRWELSEADHQRIESARRYWMEFEEVPLKVYRRLDSDTVANLPQSENVDR